MSDTIDPLAAPVLYGRSSSHFTRVARIFAAELQVEHRFEIVRDLQSRDAAAYGGNPALKMPTLRTSAGVWFGSLPICRELARRSTHARRIVWPEHLDEPVLADAQELTLQSMATEVALIMSGLPSGDDVGPADRPNKPRDSLVGSLAWLEDNAERALDALPTARDLSFLEVTLFCLVSHLAFRGVVPTEPYPRLRGFCERFAARPSAAATTYRFDS